MVNKGFRLLDEVKEENKIWVQMRTNGGNETSVIWVLKMLDEVICTLFTTLQIVSLEYTLYYKDTCGMICSTNCLIYTTMKKRKTDSFDYKERTVYIKSSLRLVIQ